MSLYSTTKDLIELITKVKPGYDLKNPYNWVINPPDNKSPEGYQGNEDDLREHGSLKEGYIYAITTDALRSIIRDLFKDVENPELKRWSVCLEPYLEEGKETWDVDTVGGLANFLTMQSLPDMDADDSAGLAGTAQEYLLTPKSLANDLIRRYFELDDEGQSWWDRDEVGVLEDLKKMIKEVYKM